MEEFFSFRKFITPKIITIIFWLGVIGSVLAGLGVIIAGIQGQGIMVLVGLLYIILGPIVVKVYCELVIIAFRIYETLVEIRDKS